MKFEKFSYQSLDEIKEDVKRMNLGLRFSDNTGILSEPVNIQGRIVPNSLAFHPMEGCDGEPDGAPSELVKRRYTRLAGGRAGLIWFEAVAVVREGRAYPRQLWINRNNVPEYKKLLGTIMDEAARTNGSGFRPLVIMQLTHSGRFSKPDGRPAPVIASHNPYIDKVYDIKDIYRLITDDQLEELEDRYAEAAVLAAEAGFHGVDIKACHRYLVSELLSSHTREGRYGGGFERRTSFLLNVVDKIYSRVGRDFIVASRLNLYDGIPRPYGWGVGREDFQKPDLSEPIKLAGILYDKGVRLLNTTMGSPYYNPHVNRPFDAGEYVPDEHPLEGMARLINGSAQLQKAVAGMAVVGTGYSWLRHFSHYLASGMKESGGITVAGYGRQAIAYPDFPRDILGGKGLKKQKCCITCGRCTELMRSGSVAGCVIRDGKVYGALYNKYVKRIDKGGIPDE